MNLRGLIVAAILLAIGAGAFWYFERGKKAGSTETKPEEKLLALKADDLQQISINPMQGEPVTLKREGDKWKIAEPRPLPADDAAVSSVVGTVTGLNISETIEEKPGSLADYGLDLPQAKVRVTTKSGATHTILVGQDTPTGSSVYAKTEDKPRVVTVASYVKSDLTKGLFDLRDKSALKVDSGSASRLWLQNKSGKLELVKAEDKWRLAAPVEARADSFAVNDLLRQAGDAKMQAIETEQATSQDEAKFGLNKPEFVVRVQDAAGSHELKVSAEKSGKRYARSSDQAAIFTVGSELATQLGKAPNELRNKDLFDMDTWTTNALDITTPEAHVVFTKQDSTWKGADPKKAPEASAVSDVLEKLKALRATEFPPAGAAAKYGLDKPVLRATITWGEKKSKETVIAGQLGSKAYAQREGEAAVYEISPEALKSARDAVNKIK